MKGNQSNGSLLSNLKKYLTYHMKLKIKDKEIELKNKIRAYLIYEQLTDANFSIKTVTDIMIYFYSLILANEKDIQLTFDEFMDYLDENPNALVEFTHWIIQTSKIQDQFVDVKKKTESQ